MLLPIVYNAMAARADLRATRLFETLERAMASSTYWPLLHCGSSATAAV